MKFKRILILGIIVHVGSFLLMLLRVEPFHTFNVPIAFWSMILVVGAVNELIFSNSVVFRDRWSLFQLAAMSVLFWLMFEIFNFRLENWQYIGVPIERIIRWPVFLLAFSALLPAVLEISSLLNNLGTGTHLKANRRIKVTRALIIRFGLLGSLAIASALVSPSVFFPLIWLGPLFVFDPIVYRFGNPGDSLLGNLEKGRAGLWIQLSLTGFMIGFFSQLWSFWAGAKWLYTIPGYDFLYLFELPILAYLVFPFLAMDFYVLFRIFQLLFKRGWIRGRARKVMIGFLLFVYVEGVIWGLDEFTVLTYRIVF